jgi:hypothetical protein
LLAVALPLNSVWAQSPPASNGNLFQTLRIDALISVSRNSVGGDFVEATLLRPGLSLEAGNQFADRLCAALGGRPEGRLEMGGRVATITGAPPKVSFNTSGLVQPDGTLRLNALAQALTGLPAPGIQGAAVLFQGVEPTTNTISSFRTAAIEIEGYTNVPARTLEYRIKISTDDPEKISIPESRDRTVVRTEPEPRTFRLDPAVLALLLVAGLSAGALVYFLLLRNRSR